MRAESLRTRREGGQRPRKQRQFSSPLLTTPSTQTPPARPSAASAGASSPSPLLTTPSTQTPRAGPTAALHLLVRRSSSKFLGSIISSGLFDLEKCEALILAVSQPFGALRSQFFGALGVELRGKRGAFEGIVVNLLHYGSETWALTQDMRTRIRSPESIAGVCAPCVHTRSQHTSHPLGEEVEREEHPRDPQHPSPPMGGSRPPHARISPPSPLHLELGPSQRAPWAGPTSPTATAWFGT